MQDLVRDYVRINKKSTVQKYSGFKKSQDRIQLQIDIERRSLIKANERLAKTRVTYYKKHEDMKTDVDCVNNMIVELKEKHIAFEDFIKANQEKRERAQKGLLGNIAAKEMQLDELKKDINTWMKMKRAYDQHLRQTKFYEHFLEDVVTASAGEFKDCDAIVKRYEAVSETREMCKKKREDDVVEMKEYLQNLQQKHRAYKMEIVTMGNRVCALQQQYSAVHEQALLWNDIVQRAKDTIINSSKENQQISAACWGLYVLTCHRQNNRVNAARPDIGTQMTSIKDSLLKGAKILAQVKEDSS